MGAVIALDAGYINATAPTGLGSHTLQVAATDLAGRVSMSAVTTINVIAVGSAAAPTSAVLTPLAADTGYVPQTAALKAILPYLDHLGDGSRVERLCSEVLSIARTAA